MNYIFYSSPIYYNQYQKNILEIDKKIGVFMKINNHDEISLLNGSDKINYIKINKKLKFWEDVLNLARIRNNIDSSYSFRERFNYRVKRANQLKVEFNEAISKRSFYQLKRFLEKNEFSLLVYLISSCCLIHNIFFWLKIRDSQFFKQLDGFKIDNLIFCLHGEHAETHSLIKYCKKRNIKLIFFQHNWDNLSSKEILHTFPNKLLVWSYQSFLHATSILKMHPSDVIIAGNPRLDDHLIAKNQYICTKGMNSVQSQKIIFFGDSASLDEYKVLLVISEILNEFGPEWICEYRPHPYMNKKRFQRENCPTNIKIDKQFENDYFSNLLEDKIIGFERRITSLSSEDFVKKVFSADIIIAAGSTICLESILMGRKMIMINSKVRDVHVLDKTHFFGINKTKGLQIIDEENINKINLLKAIKNLDEMRLENRNINYFYNNVEKPIFKMTLGSLLN